MLHFVTETCAEGLPIVATKGRRNCQILQNSWQKFQRTRCWCNRTMMTQHFHASQVFPSFRDIKKWWTSQSRCLGFDQIAPNSKCHRHIWLCLGAASAKQDGGNEEAVQSGQSSCTWPWATAEGEHGNCLMTDMKETSKYKRVVRDGI